MENIEISPIADTRCRIGENPLWHPNQECLYWVDIPSGTLMRFYPETLHSEIAYESEEAIGGFTLQESGELLLFGARGAVYLWDAGEIKNVVDELPRERDSRFNDVIADPQGRVFCGTMSSDSHAGRLYRLETDGTIHVVLEDVGTSNGMGFTPDGRGFYHTDTRRHSIFLYDYDRTTGEISNRRVFVTVRGEGRPDGMTVDCQGHVWSALWEGGCIVRYSPDGHEQERVRLSANKVTSLSFGGADYEHLYITTAGGENRAAGGEGAGALFRLNTTTGGTPEFRSGIPTR